MKHQPSILQQMLATVLNIIMFEDCRNQWSMSRPLLPLILLNNEVILFVCSLWKGLSLLFMNINYLTSEKREIKKMVWDMINAKIIISCLTSDIILQSILHRFELKWKIRYLGETFLIISHNSTVFWTTEAANYQSTSTRQARSNGPVVW